ncbi:hypothetical protein [Halalkalicoccus sp. NIPERK01]|uniref:hypothetical protein n=1 Tax=Halalkalicoccus sp. NIPERK01 TaxID=3053469 RepID=UPI00256F34E6|nr:hypothetical protein [Halalkalicoccus sp. NIPERK01]MDL5363912.1 hypothetical protein [Halalkalicoccus sp. NIPERK01]
MGLESKEAIRRAERMLKGAYLGLKQFESGTGEEKYIGIYNAVSFGRNLTFALQKATSEDTEFKEWYEDRVQVLKEDPVCRHMKNLRNDMEKEGETGVSNYASFSGNPAELQREVPPWADSIFVGDEWGGSGFSVETGDGDEVKFYMEFENADIESGLYFSNLENEEYSYNNPSDAEDDLKYYLKILAELIRDAKAEFVGDE